jgi:hypothetical protein
MSNELQRDKNSSNSNLDNATKQTIEKLSSAELKKEVKKDSHLIDNHKIKK